MSIKHSRCDCLRGIEVVTVMAFTSSLSPFCDAMLLQVTCAFEKLTAVRENGPLPFQYPTTELETSRRRLSKYEDNMVEN